MNSKLKIKVGIINDSPIHLLFEPAGPKQARVYLIQDDKKLGYAQVFISDLVIAAETLERLQ